MARTRDDILEELDVARVYGDTEQIERLEDELYDLDELDDEPEPDYDDSLGMTDVEADADVLRSCGWGMDEDYGYFGDE